MTAGGIALYAPERVQTCPEFVMATLDELAGHGISRVADVLPQALRPVLLTEEETEQLAAAGNRAVNDLVHEDTCGCDAWPEKCLSRGGYFQGYWDWGYLETAVPAVIGLWESMRGDELQQLRARVAELEAEQESPLAFAEQLDAKSLDTFLIALQAATEYEPQTGAIAQIHELIRSYRGDLCRPCGCPKRFARHADDCPAGQCEQAGAGEAACCHLHKPDCCDPEDCGPCCEACPSCPTLARQRATQAPYASRLLPPRDAVCARPGCGHPGVEHHHADTKCWVRLSKPLGAPVTVCGCSGFVAGAGESS